MTLALLSDPELFAIARTFYDKVYAHPWIGVFFRSVDQGRQETKLVRFFHMSWDDPMYAQMQGHYLKEEHAHMFIPAELFDLRQTLFAEAMVEHGHPEALVQTFLEFNERWRPFVVKASIDECSNEYTGHSIVEVPPPS